MRFDALAWLVSATVLLIGAALGLLTRRERLRLPLTALAAGLIGVLIGVGWHTWRPGAPTADALAILAGGALIVTAWAAPRWAGPPEAATNERSVALAGALLGAAVVVFAAAALAWRGTTPAAGASVLTWPGGPRAVLTSLGLGGWLPAFAGSMWGLWLAGRRGEFPAAATDRGRAAALFSYPWLTAALGVMVLWNLAASASVVALQPGDLWPLVAWLLGAAYLHATSSWRPRRVAAWLATILVGLAAVAAVLAALSTGTLI